MELQRQVCPSCGAQLEISSSSERVTCEFCQNQFSIPQPTNEPEPPALEQEPPAPSESPLATLSAEEVVQGNPAWTVELYPDRIRLLGPEGVQQTLPREGIRGQVDLMMGLTLRRILLAPLRGDTKRKDPLRFDPEGWETLSDWIGYPKQEDLSFVIQRRASTGLMIGLVFVISAFMNTTVAASPAQNAYLFVGGWLVGVWLVSKVWPRRILLLLDSGAYAVIGVGLASVLKVGFNPMSAILLALCIGLVVAGINHYRVHRKLRDGEPGSPL